MNRRMPLAVVSAAAVAFLVLAASSGPVRLWVTPEQIGNTSGGSSDPMIIVPQIPAPKNRTAWPSWLMTLLPVVGVLLMVLVVIAAISVRIAIPLPRFGRLRARRRESREIAALPEVADQELPVDWTAARFALSTGSPRNAIVACWMQLEKDAATAGLPRLVAETPAEYVHRVVASSSVDPGPINELAALYREARFSQHELRDGDRTRAMRTLRRIEATLRRGREVSA